MTLDSFFVFMEKHLLKWAVVIIYTVVLYMDFFFLEKIYLYWITQPNNINGNIILIPK